MAAAAGKTGSDCASSVLRRGTKMVPVWPICALICDGARREGLSVGNLKSVLVLLHCLGGRDLDWSRHLGGAGGDLWPAEAAARSSERTDGSVRAAAVARSPDGAVRRCGWPREPELRTDPQAALRALRAAARAARGAEVGRRGDVRGDSRGDHGAGRAAGGDWRRRKWPRRRQLQRQLTPVEAVQGRSTGGASGTAAASGSTAPAVRLQAPSPAERVREYAAQSDGGDGVGRVGAAAAGCRRKSARRCRGCSRRSWRRRTSAGASWWAGC